MMSLEEKTKLYSLIDKAEQQGDFAKIKILQKQIPIDPSIAMIAKEVYGSDYLKHSSLNLKDAEEQYGKDWLNR